MLMLKGLEFNLRIFVKYVKTKANKVADALNRGQWGRFEKYAKRRGMNRIPEKLPGEIWPIEKIWALDN